jgi:hypothetical protein
MDSTRPKEGRIVYVVRSVAVIDVVDVGHITRCEIDF